MMRHLIILVFTILFTLTALGSNSNLRTTGFKIIQETNQSIELQFHQKPSFIISKERFESKKDAALFCSNVDLTLDSEGFAKALLIAMSGASSLSPILKEAITFKIIKDKEVMASGIWAWSASGENITLMYDGKGTATNELPISQLVEVGEQLDQPDLAKLPAICI